jgi:hypothetical protein
MRSEKSQKCRPLPPPRAQPPEPHGLCLPQGRRHVIWGCWVCWIGWVGGMGWVGQSGLVGVAWSALGRHALPAGLGMPAGLPCLEAADPGQWVPDLRVNELFFGVVLFDLLVPKPLTKLIKGLVFYLYGGNPVCNTGAPLLCPEALVFLEPGWRTGRIEPLPELVQFLAGDGLAGWLSAFPVHVYINHGRTYFV